MEWLQCRHGVEVVHRVVREILSLGEDRGSKHRSRLVVLHGEMVASRASTMLVRDQSRDHVLGAMQMDRWAAPMVRKSCLLMV